jgi:hypothetical protein
VRRTEELLTLPVRVRGIALGRPVDLILDGDSRRVVGFDVLCGDDEHRFLPFAVATLTEDSIEIQTPLVLLEFDQVEFYRERGASLRDHNGGEEELAVDVDGALLHETR